MRKEKDQTSNSSDEPVYGRGGKSMGRILLLLSFFLAASIFLWQPPTFHIGSTTLSWDLMRSLTIILASSISLVLILTPPTIIIARNAGAVDYPGGRHIHKVPTPRWGGIPIAVGVLAALLLTSPNYMPNLRAMLLGAALILIAGLLDDLHGISAGVKLFVQLAACVILILDGVSVTFLPPTWWGNAGEWIITIVWTIGITNAVNFLDGMDGLVAGLVTGTSAIFFTLAMLLGANMLAYCSLALFGVSIAFLSFNVKPARIFLGDGGSNFLGFFLAALSFHGRWAKNDPIVSLFIPILLLSVPIYDMVFTTVSRIFSGKVRDFRSWIEFTDTDHIHHRLEALGLSRGQVVLTICFLNMAIGLGAIALFEARTYGAAALILQAVCVYTVLALLEALAARHRRNGALAEAPADRAV